MLITYNTINKIQFPVYKLPSSNWELIDGLLLLDNILLDDKNMPGNTLGIRRVQTPFKELVPLKHCIKSHIGLIKNSFNTYIDFRGNPFLYIKTCFCKLKYHRIRKIDRKGTASILWLYTVATPFIIPRPPKELHTWAGVLYLNEYPWLLYDYSKTKQKTTRRKV